MAKASETIEKIINTNIVKATRQVGDTKVGSDGVTRYWTEIKPGKFDWRKSKGGGSDDSKGKKEETDSDDSKDSKPQSKSAKLKKFLSEAADDKLVAYAKKSGNDPTLRKMAYDELVERGVDVSDINLKTGKYKQALEMFGGDDDSKSKTDSTDDSESEDDSEDGGEEQDWRNEDFIKKKFGGLKTKNQRIAADAYIHSRKIKEPDYKTPQQEIHGLNTLYAQFFKTDSPLMIASGGAGVGKSFNMHQVAKFMGKKPFDPEVDSPGDADYDYVEAPEIKSDTQLAQLLKEHNGKIIVFDDSDNIFRNPETMGILKKATASSGKRIVGKKSSNKSSNVDPFEFTGKVMFLTNMSQSDFVKNEHLNAVYSRGLKKDIQFTKKEQLDLIEKLRHQMNFTGVDRLPNKADDIKERDEVFEIIKNNVAKIDPDKFTSRLFKEALEQKRGIDQKNTLIESDPVTAKMLFGDVEDWKPAVENFITKGIIPGEDELEKAMEYLELT